MGFDLESREFVTIPEGWTCKRLIDCTIDGNVSYGIVQPGQHVSHGVPVIRINNINNGQLNLQDVLRVDPEIEKKFQRTRLEGGEVLLTIVGSTGQSFIAPNELKGWNVPRAIAVIRSAPEIGSDWINICLQSKETKHFLDVRANTTVQKTLNLKDVRDIPILLPPKETKKIIEGIATSIAKKIELNRQTNQTLEQIAQALFKSWFVDFEPTRAKIAAKEAGASPEEIERAAMCAISGKNPEQLAQLPPETQQNLKTTAAQFPDALVDSELGEIPAGWEVKSLSAIIEIIGGGTPKRSEEAYWNGDIPWFSVRDVPASGDIFVVDTEEKITELGLKKSSTKLLPVGTTIISARGTVGKLALVATPMCMNQSCYGIRGKVGFGAYFTYFNLREAVDTLLRNVHGAVFDTITTQTFESYSMAVSDEILIKEFDVKVEPLLKKIESNVRENIVLSDLRDSLLPKLLSGEIEVTHVN